MKQVILKFIVLCLLVLFGLGKTYGQAVEENQEVRDYLDNMFQHLDKSKVPRGLLRDYAFELVNLDRFTGSQLTDSSYVDRQTFEMLLRTIRSSAIGTKPFGDVDDIFTKQYSYGSKNTASISAFNIHVVQSGQTGSSYVGLQGGEQYSYLPSDADVGFVFRDLCNVAGMWYIKKHLSIDFSAWDVGNYKIRFIGSQDQFMYGEFEID